MKKYAKFAAIFLALALILSLSACGDTNTAGKIDQSGQNAARSTAQPTEAPAASEPTSSGDTSANQPTAETDEPAETGSDFDSGAINGGTYTNEFMGFACDLDETWTYYSQDQIAELSGQAAGLSDDEDIKKMMENGSSYIDMYASASEGLLTINVAFENLGLLYGATLDADGYADLAVDNLVKAIGSMGAENVEAEKRVVSFAGGDETAIYLTAEYQGVPLYELLVCVKQGNYMCCVTFTSYTADLTAEMSALFYAL